MEITNYQETGTYDYNAWLKYVNCNALPQYVNCNALPQNVYCMEPMKYHDASVRREHKDLLFRLLMQDKENLLSVYNALNGTDYHNAEELQIVTLEDAIYMKYKNDVSFLFQSYLTLYEHQSTFNPNMPLRDLFYVTAQLGREYNNRRIYGRKQVKIPTPKFVVFYNGNEERPENEVLKLSDAFERKEEEPELELKVRVININKGHNEEIKKVCRVLHEYSEFTDCIRKHRVNHSVEEAVVMAVDECIEKDILKDFLIKQKSEVIETMLFEYDEEEVLKFLKQQEYEIGLEEGEERGKIIGRAEGEASGKVKGLAEAVIELLELHSQVPQKLRERINKEINSETLRKWLVLASTTESIEKFQETM